MKNLHDSKGLTWYCLFGSSGTHLYLDCAKIFSQIWIGAQIETVGLLLNERKIVEFLFTFFLFSEMETGNLMFLSLPFPASCSDTAAPLSKKHLLQETRRAWRLIWKNWIIARLFFIFRPCVDNLTTWQVHSFKGSNKLLSVNVK